MKPSALFRSFGAFCLGALLLGASTSFGKNLIEDPQFKEVDFETPHYQRVVEKGFKWIFHVIQTPAEAVKEDGAVKLSGGIAFLHSSRFDVEAGKEYQAGVTAKGKGELRLDFLWFGRGVEERRTVVLDTTKVDGDAAKEFSGKAKAPENATQAFLRIVVEKGEVTVSAPSVTAN